MERFRDFYRYTVPIVNPEKLQAAIDKYNKNNVWLDFNAPALDYVGLELEVENVQHIRPLSNAFWTTVTDGSLRGGFEYKTRAIPPAAVPYALYDLEDYFKKSGAQPSYNERTSVHVHIDFRSYTPEDLIKLVLVYLAFEKYLYLYAGPERYKSNFCVPLSDVSLTNLNGLVRSLEANQIRMGELEISILSLLPQKYSALNVIPLFRGQRVDEVHSGSGSLEFRHMAGTNDFNRIVTWVGMLLHMKQYAIRTSYKEIKNQIVSLNTHSGYQEFADAVFGPYGQLLLPLSMTWKLLSQSLALTKQALTNEFIVKGTDFLRSPLAAQLQAKHEKGDRPTPVKKEQRLAALEVEEINWDEVGLINPQPINPVNAARGARIDAAQVAAGAEEWRAELQRAAERIRRRRNV